MRAQLTSYEGCAHQYRMSMMCRCFRRLVHNSLYRIVQTVSWPAIVQEQHKMSLHTPNLSRHGSSLFPQRYVYLCGMAIHIGENIRQYQRLVFPDHLQSRRWELLTVHVCGSQCRVCFFLDNPKVLSAVQSSPHRCRSCIRQDAWWHPRLVTRQWQDLA